jgi:hypothetical protein
MAGGPFARTRSTRGHSSIRNLTTPLGVDVAPRSVHGFLIAPGLVARVSAQRIGGSVNRRQPDHLDRKTGITVEQLRLRGPLRDEFGDHVHGYASAAKDGIAAHDLGIADDQAAGAAQLARPAWART